MQAAKTRVALTSVLAAVFLTAIKLIVGFSTSSLGILSEAAHSAMDLGAALLTYVAVRISDKPPDEDHAYGHGKVENISAFMQTGILILTCFFIIKSAVERLWFDRITVEVTTWSFAVMMVSIIVDYSRTRALLRVARTYRSQALEADALHFSTDIWSSLVVIFGLIAAYFGWHEGDSLAAIGVAIFVLFVTGRLFKETIAALTDQYPKDIAEKIKKLLMSVDGVQSFRHLRVRQSGSKVFVDMYIMIKRTVAFERAHEVTEEVENKIAEIVKNADVIIHMEPQETDDESIIDKIRMIVIQEGLACHNVRAQNIGGKYIVDFHLECDPYHKFADAHAVSSRIEKKLIQKIPQIRNVKTHIEDARDKVLTAKDITPQSQSVIKHVNEIAAEEKGVVSCSDLIVLQFGEHKKLLLNCIIDPNLSLDEVHAIMTSFENHIYQHLPEITHVVIHPEIVEQD